MHGGTPASRSPRAVGRPKDLAKRAAILDAAKAMFLERAYGEVTMEGVAIAASVSKMTVYGHFSDKEMLFEAVVRLCTADVVAAVSDVGETDGTLRGRLRALGLAFLRMLCRPEMVAADRNLARTLAGNKDLAIRFYDAGPGHVRAALAETLAAAPCGELAVDNPLEAADDLLSLWAGYLPRLLSLGIIDAVGPDEIERRVEHAIDVFLRAYGPVR